MTCGRWIAIALVCSMCLTAPLSAANPPSDSLAAYIAAEGDRAAKEAGEMPSGGADTPRLRALDEKYRETLQLARIAQAEFAVNAINYQMTAYRRHLFWSDAAAVMVYLLTGFGMLCAGVQFRLLDRLRGRHQGQSGDGEDARESAGTVELPGGLKASSPFLGVIILVISLAFFSLYLTEVYPIKPSNSAPLTLPEP